MLTLMSGLAAQHCRVFCGACVAIRKHRPCPSRIRRTVLLLLLLLNELLLLLLNELLLLAVE